MSACFLVPWKQATLYGEPRFATLVLLTTAAAFNSGAALLPQLRTHEESKRPLGPTLKLSLVFAVLTLAGNLSSAEAVSRISSSLLAVLQRCEVLVVGLLSVPLLRERVRLPFWIGTATAAIGVVLLQHESAGSQTFEPTGVLFGLGSACAFGTMIVLTRRHIHEVSPVLLNAVRLWLSVALWFVVQRALPSAAELPGTLVFFAALAGFFGPFLARLGALFSARGLTASTTAIASLATPVLTLLLSFLIHGTWPTGQELLGGAVLLVGVAVPLFADARLSERLRSSG